MAWAYAAALVIGALVSIPLAGWRISRIIAHEGVGYVPALTP